MCTVHSFPHNIDHCLTFARSEFEGHLEKAPAEANVFLLHPANYLQVPAVFAAVCVACRHGICSALSLSSFGKHTAWHHDCVLQHAGAVVLGRCLVAIEYEFCVLTGSSAIFRCCGSRAA